MGGQPDSGARQRAETALRSYELIGEGDWTPQDIWGQRCAQDVLVLLAEKERRGELLAELRDYVIELERAASGIAVAHGVKLPDAGDLGERVRAALARATEEADPIREEAEKALWMLQRTNPHKGRIADVIRRLLAERAEHEAEAKHQAKLDQLWREQYAALLAREQQMREALERLKPYLEYIDSGGRPLDIADAIQDIEKALEP